MERTGGTKGKVGTVLAAVLLSAALAACGGGGGASTSDGGAATASFSLQWEAPRTYVDNTPLDPSRSIDRYEVFVTEEAAVHPEDQPIACVSGSVLEGVVAKPVTSFDLHNLSGYLAPGGVYYVSVRAVAVDNQASERTVPIEWVNEA
jgi:hypothetical protein